MDSRASFSGFSSQLYHLPVLSAQGGAHALSHLPSIYLLGTYNVRSTLLGTCNISVTKTDKDACPFGAYILVGRKSCVVQWKVMSPMEDRQSRPGQRDGGAGVGWTSCGIKEGDIWAVKEERE